MCVAASLLLAHYITTAGVVVAPSGKALVGCLFVLGIWTVIGWAAWAGWPFTIQILATESSVYSGWNIAIATAGVLQAPVSLHYTLRAVKYAQQQEELEGELQGRLQELGFPTEENVMAALMAASGMVTRKHDPEVRQVFATSPVRIDSRLSAL